MEIPLDATVMKDKFTNELVRSFTCSCGGVSWCHIACEQPKRAVAMVICLGRNTLTHTVHGRVAKHAHKRKHSQKNKHTLAQTPKKTQLATSVVQMVILSWMRQHPLACGATTMGSILHNFLYTVRNLSLSLFLMTDDRGVGITSLQESKPSLCRCLSNNIWKDIKNVLKMKIYPN